MGGPPKRPPGAGVWNNTIIESTNYTFGFIEASASLRMSDSFSIFLQYIGLCTFGVAWVLCFLYVTRHFEARREQGDYETMEETKETGLESELR